MGHEITSKAVFTAQVTSLAHEYADEAEHQEGSNYWRRMFNTDDEVLDDFILYIQNRRNPSGEQT